MTDRRTDRIVGIIEWTAGAFVLAMMLNTVVAIILRYFFATATPDDYDIGRFMLCILVLWGISTTSYRGGHITMDMLWTVAAKGWRRAIDLFAGVVSFAALAVLCLSLLDQTLQTRQDNILTYDTRMPTWPFLAIAWLGTVAALVLIAIRVFKGLRSRSGLDDDTQPGAEQA